MHPTVQDVSSDDCSGVTVLLRRIQDNKAIHVLCWMTYDEAGSSGQRSTFVNCREADACLVVAIGDQLTT